jgi:HEAT repeat protein
MLPIGKQLVQHHRQSHAALEEPPPHDWLVRLLVGIRKSMSGLDPHAGCGVLVGRRCQAADALAALGPEAAPALPALLRTLIVPVTVDCALALRVAAAAAVWKVARNSSEAIPFLAWALKDEYWGVAPRAVEILAEIGHAAVVPDLIRLAERRLAHGPFDFEKFSCIAGEGDSRPLLAAVADALGRCGRGCWEDPSYLSEARATLTKLASSDDERVRDAALRALAGREGMT